MTNDEWMAEGRRRFGENVLDWKFVCPVCKHVASVRDWKDAGAPCTAVALWCVGRWIEGSQDVFVTSGERSGPCNYAGGGLFKLNPVQVDDQWAFEFAEPDARTALGGSDE